jgi:hypothetical protein
LLYQSAITSRILFQSLWFTGGLVAATLGSICACGFSMLGLIFLGVLVWIGSLARPMLSNNVNVQGLVFTYGASVFVLLNLLINDGKISAALILLPVALVVYGIGKLVIRDYE